MDKQTKQPKVSSKERVYNFIVSYITENGYAPSVREICVGTGLHSTCTVYNHLEMLETLGKIEMKHDCSPRAIKLVGYEVRKMEGSA